MGEGWGEGGVDAGETPALPANIFYRGGAAISA